MADSPCVRNCCLDQHDCCLGCGRLLNEITQWHNASAERRAEILQLAAKRQQQRAEMLAAKRREANPFE